MRAFLFISALALLACAGTDTTGDTASADPGDDLYVPNACGEWAAIEDGREWAYRYTPDNDLTGTWTDSVTRFKGSVGTVETSGSNQSGSTTQDFTTTTEFSCDDGYHVTKMTMQYAGTSDGTPFSGESVTTYDEPVLLWPASIAKGDTWEAHYVGTSKVDGKKTDFDYSATYTARGLEDVTVKAGTYKAFRVVVQPESGDSTSIWLSSGVGTVQGDWYELTDLR